MWLRTALLYVEDHEPEPSALEPRSEEKLPTVISHHPDNSPQAFVDSVSILHEETRTIMKIWEHEACRSRSGFSTH